MNDNFTTPSKSKVCNESTPNTTFLYSVANDSCPSNNHQDSNLLSPEKCSICLGSLCSVYCNEDPDTIVVQTKCKHLFHESCLKEVKQRKPVDPECPLCRTMLSPLHRRPRHSSNDDHPMNIPIANQLRFAVIEAATRGRNAVRLAMLRGQINSN